MFDTLQILRSKLRTSVGDMQSSDPFDVINTRRNFASLGRYDGDVDRPYIDRELDTTIRTFQRDKGLKQDGLMHPGGETETALNRDLARHNGNDPDQDSRFLKPLGISSSVGNMQTNHPEDVKQVQQGLSRLKLLSESRLYNPRGIIDADTDKAIKTFQSYKGLRVDGKLLPGGETERTINATLLSSDDKDSDGQDNPPVPPRKPEPPKDDDGADEPPVPPKKPDPNIAAEIRQLEQEIAELEKSKEPIEQEISALEEKLAPLKEKKEKLEHDMQGANLKAFDILDNFNMIFNVEDASGITLPTGDPRYPSRSNPSPRPRPRPQRPKRIKPQHPGIKRPKE